MHVLLVYCHPRPDSFCAALRDAAKVALDRPGTPSKSATSTPRTSPRP